MKGQTHKPDDSIQLSAIAKNYSPALNKILKVKSVKIKDLPYFMVKNNYSTIQWENGSRHKDNFMVSIGTTGDYDFGKKSILEVHGDLKAKGINHVIIPSKSHTEEHPRFHVLILFDVPVYSKSTYKQIALKMIDELFPDSDKSVADAGRFIFGSPDNANAVSYWEGSNYTISNIDGLWDSTLLLRDSDDVMKLAREFEQKSPIYCPFHEDSNPSAFIDYSEKSDNWYIHCSSCGQTFWMLKEESHLERVCKDYYSYGTEVYDFGMMNDQFFYNKIGVPKFHSRTHTRHKPERDEAFDFLATSKHIRHLSRIDYISDIEADESYYEVDLGLGVITAHHRAIPIDIQDNQMVEDYLEDRFGQYLTFIKEWIAVYCYTNYKRLPTIIFNSERGNGKSSFVEILAEIFPTLSFQWGGNEDSFTYEVEKKFLVVEENQSEKVSQYKTLKKYTGQKYATVKKKFKDPYQVKNNMNIIILSNDAIPLFVSRGELPTDTKNNQFFVYEFPEITGPIDPDLQEKILSRLGHYIRTELKSVYDGLSSRGFRYSIDVPITSAEKELFAANTSDLESDVDILVSRLVEQYATDSFPDDMPYNSFIELGQLPVQWIKYYSQSTRHYNQIIKGMRRQRLLSGEADRIQVGVKRLFCFSMTDKLTQMLGIPNKPEVACVVSDVACDLFNQGA